MIGALSEKRKSQLEAEGKRLGRNSTIALPSTPGRHQKAKPRKARKPIKRSGKPKVKPRSAKESTRIYGPAARRTWLKAKPCVACVLVAPDLVAEYAGEWRCDLAHTVSGGKGRKADAATLVPMCRKHHRMYDDHVGFLALPEIRAKVIGSAAAYDISWTTRTT